MLLLSACQHGGRVLREGRSLVELETDLPVELADRPRTSQRLGLVELPGALTPHRQQPHVCGLWQRNSREKIVESHFDGSVIEFATQCLEDPVGLSPVLSNLLQLNDAPPH